MNTLNKINQPSKNIISWLPYVLLVLVCVPNLSWNITDHDDGHTLGFHNMGRNPDIQRSYGAYDSMCDYLLGFLPVDYHMLLGLMVGSTVLASFAILYFSAELLKKWFNFTSIEIAFAQLSFLVAMPEFMYMVFSFKSVYIALALILASAYVQFNNPESKVNLIIAAVLFGFGVSFRWNTLMMGAPLATMLLWELKQKNTWLKAINGTFIWGSMALCFSLFFIYISGYSPERIVKTYIWGKEYAEKTDFQLIARIGDLSLFLTPASAILFLLSGIYFIKQRSELGKFSTLFISTFLAVAVISLAPSFKLLAPLWICFIALFAFAGKLILSYSLKLQKITIGIIVCAIAINWFVGVQISTPSSNWGPGLDVKTNVESLNVFDKNLKTDERFKLENIKIGFFDGFCLPTSEGMRPLYGHFYALLMGRLHHLDGKLNQETDKVLQEAKTHQQIIYQDRVNPYLLATYTRYGFTTSDSWKQNAKEFHKRTFTNGKDTITEIRINDPKHLFDINKLKQNINPTDTIYAAFTYTSALNKFLYKWQKENNGHFEKMGPLSAKLWQ